MWRQAFAILGAALFLLVPAAGGGSGTRSGVFTAARPAPEIPRSAAPANDGLASVAYAIAPRGTTAGIVKRWTKVAPRSPRGVTPVPAPRELLLTFDDGPDMVYTPRVLDALERHNMRAIFFVAGRRLVMRGERGAAQRRLAAEMIRRGHIVANHTIQHYHLCDRPERIPHQIDGNEEIITATTGVRPTLFRTPFGDRCPELSLALAGRGLVDIGWSIDPQDWRRTDPGEIAEYVRQKIRRQSGPAILLMHDTHRAGVVALPAILDFIAAEVRRAESGEGRPLVVREPDVLFPPATGADTIAALDAGPALPAIGAEAIVGNLLTTLSPTARSVWARLRD